MLEDNVGDLLQVAVQIVELDRHEEEVTDKREWRTNKEHYDALVAQFTKQRDELIDDLLGDGSGHSDAVRTFQSHIAELRKRADPSWLPANNYTHDNVLPELTKQSGRSPKLRIALKRLPWALGALVVLAYFGIRLFSGVPISADIGTREGLEQRAAAVSKVFRYDGLMATRVRKGGMFKGLILWPIEPTDAEIKGAAEFSGLVIEGQRYASGCGNVDSFGTTLTDEQVRMIGQVADYIRSDKVEWEEPPVKAVVNGLENASAC